jgi:hypothetical protein
VCRRVAPFAARDSRIRASLGPSSQPAIPGSEDECQNRNENQTQHQHASRLERRSRGGGFPVGITVTRDGPYGATSSRLVYPDELSPEQAAYDRGEFGFPSLIELDQPTTPAAEAGADPPDGLQEASAAAPGEQAPSSAPSSGSQPALPVAPGRSMPHDSATSSLPPDFSRHARRCIICSHPDRDAIEGDFIRWNSPSQIAKTYKIADRASISRHAHSTGLFDRRKREVGRVLETVLENVDQCPADRFDTIIRAARLYTHLDNNGVWAEPPRITYFIAGPPPGPLAVPAPSRRERKVRSSKSKRFLTATRPHSKNRLTP